MTTQLPAVKIAPERLEQLKSLAATLDLSLGETIGFLISQEVERGTIRDTIPGVTIERSTRSRPGSSMRGVAFHFDGEADLWMPRALARAFADTIERAAAGAAGGVLDLDDDYSVLRVGNGVRIEAPFGSSRTFTRDVARDIARLISKAAG